MPLHYGSGTLAEHLACRNDAVVFDVSHLGTVRCDGPDMFDALQATLTNDLRKVAPGRAQYTHLLNDDGFVVDDIIVWWVSRETNSTSCRMRRTPRASRTRCRAST
jgi:aminomethyltransferase